MKFCFIDHSQMPVWEHLVQQSPSSGFMQSFFWANFKRNIGWDTYKIGVLQKNKLVGGAVIMKFHFSDAINFLYVPEGPVLTMEASSAKDYFDHLMAEIDTVADLKGKERTSHIRIEPRLAAVPLYLHRFRKAPFNMEPRDTLMIDLESTEEQLLAKMKQKYRYNIKIAEREKIRVVAEDPSRENARKFSEIYKETVERNKFDGKGRPYFEILFDHLSAAQTAKLFIAKLGNQMLAAALIIFYGNRATYFFGASSNAERNKMAPYKLHWEAIRYAKQHGYRWYDLWGVAPAHADASHGWYGLTQFKEKLGGERSKFIGAYDFVYNQQLYAKFLKESEEI